MGLKTLIAIKHTEGNFDHFHSKFFTDLYADDAVGGQQLNVSTFIIDRATNVHLYSKIVAYLYEKQIEATIIDLTDDYLNSTVSINF